jgi:hypothetical protein
LSSGTIGKRQLEVYREIIKHEKGITITQTLMNLGLEKNNSGRFKELESMGMIKGLKKGTCQHTGHTVTVYESTGKHPAEPKEGEVKVMEIQGIIFKVEDVYKIRSHENSIYVMFENKNSLKSHLNKKNMEEMV